MDAATTPRPHPRHRHKVVQMAITVAVPASMSVVEVRRQVRELLNTRRGDTSACWTKGARVEPMPKKSHRADEQEISDLLAIVDEEMQRTDQHASEIEAYARAAERAR